MQQNNFKHHTRRQNFKNFEMTSIWTRICNNWLLSQNFSKLKNSPKIFMLSSKVMERNWEQIETYFYRKKVLKTNVKRPRFLYT